MAQPRGDFQLAIGYWFVTHKQQFKTWWAIGLLTFLGLSAIWVVMFFVFWVIQQPKLDAKIAQAARATRNFAPIPGTYPSPLVVGSATAIARDAQHVDVVATIENPNHEWGAATVHYRFQIGGKSLPVATTFINPKSSRPVIVLNQLGVVGAAKLEIMNTIWRRAALAELPSPEFAVGQTTLTPTTIRFGRQNILTVRLSSQVTNRSVYSFVRVTVPIIVRSGDTIVAVDEQTIDRWKTLTDRNLTATWPYPIGPTTAAEIAPQVSQFDRNNLF